MRFPLLIVIYQYVENFSDPRGQMYFDKDDGVLCYDDGVPVLGPITHHYQIQ